MKKDILYKLIPLLPIIDAITAFQTRSEVSITLGIILKGLAILYIIYYIFFVSSSKYKKTSIAMIITSGIYVILYFGFKPELLEKMYIVSEMTYMFKVLFLPIMFIGLINYFDEYGFNKNKFVSAMKITLIEYTLLLLIPYFIGTANNTYFNGNLGYDGVFYSGNEVSLIMVMLLPYLYHFISEKKKHNWVIALPVIYSISLIGTKVSMFGTILVTVVYFIYYVLTNKFRINIKTISSFLILIITVVFFFAVNPITIQNANSNAKDYGFIEEKVIVEEPEEEKENKEEDKEEEKQTEITINYGRFVSFILSTRNKYFERTMVEYKRTFSWDYVITGIGYTQTPELNNNISKMVEIDLIDLYIHSGAIGLLINISPLLGCIWVLLKGIFSRKRKIGLNLLLGCILGIIMCISCMSGHLLFYPAAALYLVIFIIYIYGFNNQFEKEKIDYKKVQILALHLKQGGIETALTNQANMLSEKYNVEIISVYDNNYHIPYKLNDGIKVTYLMNTISNREELKEAIHSFNIFKIFKEGIKAIRILYLKPYLLRHEILNSNAGTIISTRDEFSKLLGKYKRDGVLTIGEEHVYHANDKKRIRLTKKGNKNIDYLLPTSKELVEFYKPIVNARVEYIPNVITYYPDKLNELKNKKLIAIGRLTKEKGFIDLIPIMKEINKKDKNVTLDIYGDGIEKENILNAIKEAKLEKVITIKKFVPLDILNTYRKEYSLMVIPSYEESFGLAALESMAFGIPCVIYDTATGLQEFIKNDNGIIIEKRNSKKFANAVLELLKDRKKLLTLSKNARKTSEEYSFDNVQKEFVKYIDDRISVINKIHRKVMFISSTGGHFNELTQLKKMFEMYDYEIVTEKDQTNANLKNKYNKRIHYLLYGTRFHPIPYFLFILPINCFISLFYYIKYRPEFIITTGAHTAGPMCCIGKIFGSKIIYIETFANSTTKTATGKIIYHFADLFIVQWESMLDLYPKATFGGWIF